MSDSNETKPFKSIILVSVETDDEIRHLLIGKQRIRYQFEGDDYRTKIWKEGGKIMAEDPKGIREITIVEPDTFSSTEGDKLDAGTFKGLFTQYLIEKGYNPDFVIQSVIKFTPVLNQLDEQSHNHPREEMKQTILKKSKELLTFLEERCIEQQKGGNPQFIVRHL